MRRDSFYQEEDKLKIAINAMLLSAPRFGIWTYIYNLIANLAAIDKKNSYEIFSGSSELDLDASPNFNVLKPPFDLPRPAARILWEHFVQPFLINRGLPDVYHNPDHILPLLPVKAKKIVTVHDLCFYKHPETFSAAKRRYKKMMTPVSLKRADRIIADSHSTKKDIIELFSIPEDRINVVHIGVNKDFKPLSGAKDHERPFILFVGTLEKRKNIEGLIDAYALAVKQEGISHDLVIAGRKGWLYDGIFRKVRKERLEGRVKFIFDISQEELPGLYSAAELFVYPSFYEGFGLPVLESMACGTPVITSNVSSLPEVAGDAAVLVDPKDTSTLAVKIAGVLKDPSLRRAMSQKGLLRARQFTWDKCARETLDVYRSVL